MWKKRAQLWIYAHSKKQFKWFVVTLYYVTEDIAAVRSRYSVVLVLDISRSKGGKVSTAKNCCLYPYIGKYIEAYLYTLRIKQVYCEFVLYFNLLKLHSSKVGVYRKALEPFPSSLYVLKIILACYRL